MVGYKILQPKEYEIVRSVSACEDLLLATAFYDLDSYHCSYLFSKQFAFALTDASESFVC